MSFIQHRNPVQFGSAHVFHPQAYSRCAYDQMLRTTRVSILEKAGYTVFSVVTDDDAMKLLETEQFDLILLGRRSQIPRTGLDQRLREKYPNLLTLKIKPTGDIVSSLPD
jgi:hypothetical protein